jgi:hypothetical protein
MKLRGYPKSLFKSFEEFEHYRNCVNRVRVGDRVQLVIEPQSTNIRPKEDFLIIGRRDKSTYEVFDLLIGAQIGRLDGWTLNATRFPFTYHGCQEHLPNLDQWLHNWWIHLPQTKILKIIKQ